MKTSYIVWAVFWLAFLVIEMLGVFRVFGWVSFSQTIWSLEALSTPFKAVVLGVLVVLASHLCLGWPH